MDWESWFGWRFQVSVCAALIITVLYVYARRNRIHPWWALVILEGAGLVWAAFWTAVALNAADWLSLILWPALLIWLGRNAFRTWRRRELRHVPVERE